MTGTDIKAWRQERELSQEAAARLVGVGLRVWQRWEAKAGDVRMSKLVVRALHDADRELGR